MKTVVDISVGIPVKIVIEKDGDGFYAYSPDLPGLHVGGDSHTEILEIAENAVIAYIASLIKQHKTS